MKEFWKNVLRVIAGVPLAPERRGIQYARDYVELHDLFERNSIDVWQVKSDVIGQLRTAGIESPENMDYGVYAGRLIEELRMADATGSGRSEAVKDLEQARRDLYTA